MWKVFDALDITCVHNRDVPFELGDLCREFIRGDHMYAAAWAAFHGLSSSYSASKAPLYRDSDHEATEPRSAAQMNTQPGTSQSREALYMNRKRFKVPVGYTGNLCNDQRRCDEFWKVIVDDRRKSSVIRLLPANQARAEAFEKLTGQKFSREQRVFLRPCGQYMEEE